MNMTKPTAIAVYDEFLAQLAELREHNAKLLFDYEDPEGNKEARSHVHKLRRTKAAVDKARQAEKAASLEYGRQVDAQAKEIIGEIEAMIEVHAKPLAEIEEREKARVAAHMGRIEDMRSCAAAAGNGVLASERLRSMLADVKAVDHATFEEFDGEAARVKDESVRALEGHLAAAEKREAEAAELERLRAEAAERTRLEREEAIRREATVTAQREAETAARAERESGERRELELRLAAERAEREKVEAESRAANAAAEAERRVKREAEEKAAAEAAETAKREQDKKHKAGINRAAVAAFVAGGMSEDVSKLAVTLIAQKAVPRVTIAY